MFKWEYLEDVSIRQSSQLSVSYRLIGITSSPLNRGCLGKLPKAQSLKGQNYASQLTLHKMELGKLAMTAVVFSFWLQINQETTF